ncbi:TIGR01244 family sulfur transferase [Parvularcula marina]|uniref:TIGR01244 family phosphatase n=1 Tax=Parvularcula marina TaxID=2292771 RepID=A0A371RK40_9PROT|nr:TIGR01244 family sulfur transferase [Parvularcula marina]RFB05818.1 TIGR01244 family phosphatase [Parvularcula marina]
MPLIPLAPQFLVAPQLSPADFDAAKEDGVTHVICNRVKGEAPGQPTMAEMAEAAAERGISFEVISASQGLTPAQMEALDLAIATHSKILAYCASGKRSALLWAATRVQAGDDLENVMSATEAAGFDFSGFRSGLASLAPSG